MGQMTNSTIVLQKPQFILLLFSIILIFYSVSFPLLSSSLFLILRWVLPTLLLIFCFFSKYKFHIHPILLISFLSFMPSIIGSVDVIYSMSRYVSFVLLILSLDIYVRKITTKEQLKTIIEAFLWISLLFQVLNSIYIILGMDNSYGRYQGFTGNPNTLGVLSIFSFLSTKYFLEKYKIYKTRVILYIVQISSFYTCIISGSRSATILILAVIIFSVVFVRGQNGIKLNIPGVIYIILPSILVLIFGFYYGEYDLLEKIPGLGRFINMGVTGDRIDLWEQNLYWFMQNPLFGLGYGVTTTIRTEFTGAHNSYITILVETGVVGFCFMIIYLMVFSFKLINQMINLGRNELSISAIFIFSLFIVAFGESFMFSLGSTEGFTLWFMIIWSSRYMDLKKTAHTLGDSRCGERLSYNFE